MKLQSKILGLLIPIIILPMVLLGYIAYQQINAIAINNAHDHIDTLLNQIRFNVENQLQKAEKDLEYISHNSLVTEYIKANEAQRYGIFYKPLLKWLNNFQTYQPQYIEVKILLPNGEEELQVIQPGIESPSSLNDNKPLYNALSLNPKNSHLALAKVPGTSKLVVLMTKPLFSTDSTGDSNQFGHLLFSINLNIKSQLPPSANKASAPNLIITNDHGTIFFETKPKLHEISKRLARSNIRTKNFNSLTDTLHNDRIVISTTQSIKSNFFISGVVSKNKLVEGARELNKSVVLITTIIIALFSIVLFTVIRVFVTTPLEKLKHHTKAITQGDLETTIDIKQNDEVGELANSFSTMLKNLKHSTEKIEELAYYDTLTGLANKVTFIETIQHFLEEAEENKTELAILFFDLDNFKNINDGLGHDVGDLLLREVSQRLKDCVRATDIIERAEKLPNKAKSNLIARMGGDEFTLVLSQINSTQEASIVAVRILAKLSQPFLLNGSEIYIGASIGISCFPHDGTTPEILLKHADIAMYEAKARGKNNFQYFDQDMNKPVSERLTLETSMRSALENDEFVLAYQPKVPLSDSKRYEFEALIRWIHPEKGFVSPGLFIPVAEETGFIQHIGEWVLNKACAQIKKWHKLGYENIVVSINLSPVQFNYGNPSVSVKNALSKYDLHPKHLEVEITESGLMQNESIATNVLNSLKELGVTIALDDFGTGYSSLAYLLRFPIDTLKIDRAFIRNLTENPQAVSVLRSIMELAKSLNLETVAEGVETKEQLDIVKEMGCNIIQGFLFAKPMPADEAMDFFDNYFQTQEDAKSNHQ